MLTLLYVIAVVSAVRGLWSPCGLSMLSTLNPVSERSRGHRFWLTACWYATGSVAGGALLGLGCAGVAWGVGRLALPGAALWAVALAAALLATVSDARFGGWSLPIHPRQVDERWVTRYRRWIYASGYGVQIGTGFATYIMTAGVYLTAALACLSGRPAAAFGAGVAFGAVRGLGIALAGTARSPGALRRLLARVDGWSRMSALIALLCCAAVAVAAAARLGGALPGLAAASALAVLVGVRGRPVLAG